ncbi:hypothetical protein ABZP36_023115 [Zizania latifolia]
MVPPAAPLRTGRCPVLRAVPRPLRTAAPPSEPHVTFPVSRTTPSPFPCRAARHPLLLTQLPRSACPRSRPAAPIQSSRMLLWASARPGAQPSLANLFPAQ